jgi:hypothetical protein
MYGIVSTGSGFDKSGVDQYQIKNPDFLDA